MQTAVTIQEIERRFWEINPENMPERAACLVWAIATVDVLREAGYRAILQAGSSSWPCISPEHDDGKMHTNFSYVWEPDSEETKRRLAYGVMPEMHVWAALPESNLIIDMTTGYLPEQCYHAAGLTWTADEPPDYLWCEADKLPPGVLYQPEIGACRIAHTMAANLLAEIRGAA